jgi:uncharacterized protein
MYKFILIVCLCSFVSFARSQTKNFIDQPYVEVTGEADTLVTPDEIFIRIQLSEKDTRDKISLEELEAKMITTLQSIGINTEKDLTTSDLLSSYRTYVLKARDIIKSKAYQLKVSESETATRVFIKLEEVGISNTSIDRVDHSRLKELKNLMRISAVDAAKQRASLTVQRLGQTLGRALFVNYVGETNSQLLQGRLAGLQLSEVVVTGYSAKNAESPSKIEFQKIKVTAEVSAKFEMK